MKSKSKRGSHVGLVLSFVIFVAFLIFLYSILEPLVRIQQDKQALLSNLKISLKEKFSSDLDIITIVIEENAIEDCIKLEGLNEIEIESGTINSHIIVKNESGGTLNIRRDNEDLFIERPDNNNIFFKIYQSDEFDEIIEGALDNCGKIGDDDYSIESIITRDEIFQEKINKTKIKYETHYEDLKTELKIPVGSEFGFSFTDKEKIIIETTEKEKATSTSVYAEEISILYVDEEANINSGFIIIKVW